jgi:hypothetical protein
MPGWRSALLCGCHIVLPASSVGVHPACTGTHLQRILMQHQCHVIVWLYKTSVQLLMKNAAYFATVLTVLSCSAAAVVQD